MPSKELMTCDEIFESILKEKDSEKSALLVMQAYQNAIDKNAFILELTEKTLQLFLKCLKQLTE